jgi:hypothetical protein
MNNKKHSHFVAPEKSIYVSDGYDHDTFAIYAWQDLPSYTSSPVNPVRCFIEGGFETETDAKLRLVQLLRT